MEKFESQEAKREAPAIGNQEQTKGFEDTFASFETIKDLKQRLRDIAESTDGKLELTEEDGSVSRTEVGEITHSISAVAEERPGYTLTNIPGKKLREAVGRILENKKQ